MGESDASSLLIEQLLADISQLEEQCISTVVDGEGHPYGEEERESEEEWQGLEAEWDDRVAGEHGNQQISSAKGSLVQYGDPWDVEEWEPRHGAQSDGSDGNGWQGSSTASTIHMEEDTEAARERDRRRRIAAKQRAEEEARRKRVEARRQEAVKKQLARMRKAQTPAKQKKRPAAGTYRSGRNGDTRAHHSTPVSNDRSDGGAAPSNEHEESDGTQSEELAREMKMKQGGARGGVANGVHREGGEECSEPAGQEPATASEATHNSILDGDHGHARGTEAEIGDADVEVDVTESTGWERIIREESGREGDGERSDAVGDIAATPNDVGAHDGDHSVSDSISESMSDGFSFVHDLLRLEGEVKSKQHQLDGINRENHRLQGLLRAREDALVGLNEKYQKAAMEVANLRAKLDSASEEARERSAELESVKERNERLVQRGADLEGKLRATRHDYEQTRTELETARASRSRGHSGARKQRHRTEAPARVTPRSAPTTPAGSSGTAQRGGSRHEKPRSAERSSNARKSLRATGPSPRRGGGRAGSSGPMQDEAMEEVTDDELFLQGLTGTSARGSGSRGGSGPIDDDGVAEHGSSALAGARDRGVAGHRDSSGVADPAAGGARGSGEPSSARAGCEQSRGDSTPQGSSGSHTTAGEQNERRRRRSGELSEVDDSAAAQSPGEGGLGMRVKSSQMLAAVQASPSDAMQSLYLHLVEVEAKLSQSTRRVKALEAEITEVKRRNVELEMAYKRSETDLKEERKRFEQSLTAQVDPLRKQLKSARATASSLKREVVSLRSTIGVQSQELRRRDGNAARLEAAELEISSFRSQVALKEKHIAQLKQKLRKAASQVRERDQLLSKQTDESKGIPYHLWKAEREQLQNALKSAKTAKRGLEQVVAQQKQRIAQLCARIDLIATSIKGKPVHGGRSHALEGVEPDSDADVQDEGMISARLYAVLEQEVFRLRAELTGRDEHLEECQEYIQELESSLELSTRQRLAQKHKAKEALRMQRQQGSSADPKAKEREKEYRIQIHKLRSQLQSELDDGGEADCDTHSTTDGERAGESDGDDLSYESGYGDTDSGYDDTDGSDV